MRTAPAPSRSLTRLPVVVGAALTTALLAVLVFAAAAPPSSSADDPKPVSSRVTTREYTPPHVWESGPAGDPTARVSTNAWRRTTADKTEVGVYIQAYGAVEGANLSLDVALAEDLAEFLVQAHARTPAARSPVVEEAVAFWRDAPESSFKCWLDLKTGAFEIFGEKGSVKIDPAEVAAILRKAIAEANELRRAPAPLPRAGK